MADAPKNPAPVEDQASVRLDKLRQLEALGIDPWGQRFDGRTPIGEIRLLEPMLFDDANPQGPRVIASRGLAGAVARLAWGNAKDPALLDANYVRKADAELAWVDRAKRFSLDQIS